MKGAVPVLIIFIEISRGVLHTAWQMVAQLVFLRRNGRAYAICPSTPPFDTSF